VSELLLVAPSLEQASSETVVVTPPPTFILLSSAEGIAGAPATREYVLQVVFADAEARQARPKEMISLGDKLDLVEIAKKLPDQRYRIYFRHEDNTLELVKEIVVRDGKPHEVAEEEGAVEDVLPDLEDNPALPGEGEPTPAEEVPRDGRQPELPAEGETEAPGPAATPGTPVGRIEWLPSRRDRRADVTSHTLGQRDVVSRGGLLLTAALAGSAVAQWQQQTDEALRQHDRLSLEMIYRPGLNKGARRC
jgi:hypothetical protein